MAEEVTVGERSRRVAEIAAGGAVIIFLNIRVRAISPSDARRRQRLPLSRRTLCAGLRRPAAGGSDPEGARSAIALSTATRYKPSFCMKEKMRWLKGGFSSS